MEKENSTTPNSSTDEMKIWQENAIKKQAFYYHALSDRKWEKYTDDENDIIHLQNKIGYILFGNPKLKGEIDIESKIIQLLGDDVITPDFFEDFNKSENMLCEDPSSPEQDKKKFPKFAELLDNLFEFKHEMTTDSELNPEDSDSELNPEDSDSELNPEDSDSDESDFFQDDSHSSDFSQDVSDSGYAELSHSPEVSNDDLCSTSESSSIPSSNFDPREDKDGYMIYYSENAQLSQIDGLITAIKSCSDNNDLLIAFIFVIAKIENFTAEFRVIRVRHGQNENKEDISYFVDTTGRCYDSWDSFLKENLYPACTYCYPKGGFYTCDENGKVLVDFNSSPGSSFSRRFINAADVATTIGGIACFITTAAAVAVPLVFPVTAPFLAPTLVASLTTGTSFGVWGTGRAVYQLIDKKIHSEKLFDQEARSLWLNAATGILSGASLGALKYTQYAARTGKVFGKAVSYIVNGIEYSTAGVAGANILNQIYVMYENRNVTFADAAGLAISVLFFCNTAIKFKDAQQILRESQEDVLDSIKSQLSRKEKRAFNKVLKGTTASNVVEGNACVIKTVQNIENPRSYFKDLRRASKSANKTKSRLSFNKNGSGKVNINNKVSVDPELLSSMSNKSQSKLFKSSKKFNKSAKYSRTFKKDMKIISKKENLAFNKDTFEFKGNEQVKSDSKLTTENKLPFVKPSATTTFKSFSKISPVGDKNEVGGDKLENEFINIFNKICNGLAMLNQGKEIFDFLMEYYNENLKEKFEKLIKDKVEEINVFISKLYKTNKEKFDTRKREFYTTIEKENNLTPWDYFETYFSKMFKFVPDRKSVTIIPHDVGWLFMVSDKWRRVDYVFMAAMRMDYNMEKILAVAFMRAAN